MHEIFPVVTDRRGRITTIRAQVTLYLGGGEGVMPLIDVATNFLGEIHLLFGILKNLFILSCGFDEISCCIASAVGARAKFYNEIQHCCCC